MTNDIELDINCPVCSGKSEFTSCDLSVSNLCKVHMTILLEDMIASIQMINAEMTVMDQRMRELENERE